MLPTWLTPINCIYTLFIQYFESDNKAIRYKLEKAAFQDNKISTNKINLMSVP